MVEKVLQFYKNIATSENVSPYSVKLRPSNDFSEYDAKFVKNYIDTSKKLLDIGSGTGLLLNKINKSVMHITAVEPFEEFSKFIERKDNVKIITADCKSFIIDEKFDVVTCFGLCNYFNKDEVLDVYLKINSLLENKGKIIVKNQFGVNEDVIINNYSEELKTDYFSEYRTVEHEKELMHKAGFKNFEVFDIYPPECNRWDNTHFYAIVAEK